VGLDQLREALMYRIRAEIALLAPTGSMATPTGNSGPVGQPARLLPSIVQARMVDTEKAQTARIQGPVGVVPDNFVVQSTGRLPGIRQRQGQSQLWIDIAEPMPISAVPPQIRKSLYQPLTHRVGLYPMYDKWYPIALGANTRNDVRYSVGKPPPLGPATAYQGVTMSRRPQFRQAWRVPRYSTQPDTTTPTSNPGPFGGGTPS
jgi:hypothetical protein